MPVLIGRHRFAAMAPLVRSPCQVHLCWLLLIPGRPSHSSLKRSEARRWVRADIAGTATLDDFRPDPDAGTRRSVRREHVPDVQADDLGEAQAGAKGQAVDHMVAGMAAGCAENRFLFADGQGGRTEVRDVTRVANGGGKSRTAIREPSSSFSGTDRWSCQATPFWRNQ